MTNALTHRFCHSCHRHRPKSCFTNGGLAKGRKCDECRAKCGRAGEGKHYSLASPFYRVDVDAWCKFLSQPVIEYPEGRKYIA